MRQDHLLPKGYGGIGGRAQTDGATQVVAKLRAELQQLTIDHERLKARSATPIIARSRPPAAHICAATRPHLRLPRRRPLRVSGPTDRSERAGGGAGLDGAQW